MKKLLLLFYLLIFLSPYLLIPIPVQAQEKAQAADVGVTAQVPSPVSPDKSYSTLNMTETLADPANHPLLLTVYLLDNSQKPIANREVIVTSNRGQVDIIEEVSQISFVSSATAAEISAEQKGTTDSEGKVSFRITSFIPGRATLKILGDSVELKSQTIEFSPLPFPTNLTLSVGLPFSDKEFVFFSPRPQEEHFSVAQQNAKTLANPGTKVRFNFWAFLMFVLFILMVPTMLVIISIILHSARKSKMREIKQLQLLEKIASSSSSSIEDLKNEIKKNGYGYNHDGVFNSVAKTPPPK